MYHTCVATPRASAPEYLRKEAPENRYIAANVREDLKGKINQSVWCTFHEATNWYTSPGNGSSSSASVAVLVVLQATEKHTFGCRPKYIKHHPLMMNRESATIMCKGEDEFEDVGVLLEKIKLLGGSLRGDDRLGLTGVLGITGSDEACSGRMESLWDGEECTKGAANRTEVDRGSDGFFCGGIGGRLGTSSVSNDPRSSHACAAWYFPFWNATWWRHFQSIFISDERK
jgi:hypothetical protein